MDKVSLRKGVTLITLREDEVWDGSIVDGTYLQAFVKMIVGKEIVKTCPSLRCPSQRLLGKIHIQGPAIFERHYHSFL